MNSPDPMMIIGILLIATSLMIVSALITFKRVWRSVSAHQALIVNTTRNVLVHFAGAMVLPVFHRAETMDLRTQIITVDRVGPDVRTLTKNDELVSIQVMFYVRVNTTRDDVMQVANAIGAQRASDPKTVEQLFTATFSEAIKTTCKRHSYDQLRKQRDSVMSDILAEVGHDMNGYSLEAIALTRLDKVSA